MNEYPDIYSMDGGAVVAELEETFGERLRRLREEAELTQQQLAGQCGISLQSVASLEQDKHGPTWSTVKSLARALGVNCLAFEDTIDPPPLEERKKGKRGRPPGKKPPEVPTPPTPGEPEQSGQGEGKPARKRKAKE